ncbi:MAG: hypothetical protein K6U08_09265 [Firmicutes bacterium]|nr:hypothetical protein [Bacillota bacterium]
MAVPWSGEEAVAALLERTFREVAFFLRVPLDDLALVRPEARGCRTKAEFLRPHLRLLEALVRLTAGRAPGLLTRLAQDYPEVMNWLTRSRGSAEPPEAHLGYGAEDYRAGSRHREDAQKLPHGLEGQTAER